MSRILIAGASGAIGRLALARLLADSRVSAVHVVARRALAIDHDKLSQHIMPLSELDVFMPDFQVDVAINSLGTTIRTAGSQAAFRAIDQDAVLAFARLARRAGADHFLSVSAIGASPRAASFYSRVKGEVEVALEAMDFAALTLLQPSLLLGPREESRPAEAVAKVLARPLGPLLRGALAAYRPIEADDVAAALAAAALAPASGVSRLTWTGMMRLARRA